MGRSMASRVRTCRRSTSKSVWPHDRLLRIRTVLHDITDDAEFIEVTTTALSAERLLKCDLDVVDVVTVPCGVEELVAKSQDENVLDHLLTEVVVDTEDLLLLPVRVQSLLQIARALKILAERLLNLWGN